MVSKQRFNAVSKIWLVMVVFALLVLAACSPVASASQPQAASPAAPTAQGVQQTAGEANVRYTLKTGMDSGKMVFFGVGGDIDGQVNPDLKAAVGDTVEVTLVNGDGIMHDFTVPDLGAATEQINTKDSQSKAVFEVEKDGTFAYICSLPGHRQAGMEGKLIVGSGQTAPGQTASGQTPSGQTPSATQAAPEVQAPSISRAPDDLPAAIGSRAPQKLRIDLETVEVKGRLADGSAYTFWTFNGKVPGPFIRVRIGDTIEVHLKNAADSMMAHSVDFHAVTGPGGGAVATQTLPGGETTFTFKALNPGLFVYHCATPMVAQHITNGMYGMILVEPEGGLPPVDREYYVMQGELYTQQPFDQAGDKTFDLNRLLDERPTYFVLNGAVGALTTEHPLKAKTGETVRIFYGVGGPNFTSSFHVIGEIFDRVYDQGSLTAEPLTNVQTTLVPAGGATMVEFKTQVPGRYILVDHALSRMERGLAGYLIVEGPDAPDIFQGQVTEGSGH